MGAVAQAIQVDRWDVIPYKIIVYQARIDPIPWQAERLHVTSAHIRRHVHRLFVSILSKAVPVPHVPTTTQWRNIPIYFNPLGALPPPGCCLFLSISISLSVAYFNSLLLHLGRCVCGFVLASLLSLMLMHAH